MFTGLVETLGRVERVVDENSGRRFFLSWPGLTEPLAIGESVAVNGCCLTVVAASNERFELQAGPETLVRTNLGDKQAGDRVNLERSLRVGDRLGGHFVQGHIDTTALLRERRGKENGSSWPSRSTPSGPRCWSPRGRSPLTA